MLIILFGLSGSGKNYIGNKLKEMDCIFWDADKALTHPMAECIKQNKPFTQEMRDHFCLIIIERIRALQTEHSGKNIVISQALYKEVNREQIATAFPEAKFVEVQASLDVIQQRLHTRGNWVSSDYAAQISAHYEVPMLPHIKIKNQGQDEKALNAQLVNVLTNKNVEATATASNQETQPFSLFSVALPYILLKTPTAPDPAHKKQSQFKK